jgi:hypothetical protein
MVKVTKIYIPIDIHSNTDETFDFIDENLPRKYSDEVYNLLPENNKFEKDYIRKVKNDRINNAVIISYLYVVAQRYFESKNI